MKFEQFDLERNQSLFENKIDFNLSESGVHPLKLSEMLTEFEQKEILNTELFYGYTNGTPELRHRVADIYGNQFTKENILITSGSAETNFLSVMAQLDQGDEIIYMVLNYLQIFHLAKSFRINVKTLPIRQELGWQWDPYEIKNMITVKTKMIAVCNPNNPTGSVMANHILHKIIEIVSERDIWLLSDEVYRGSELNGQECRSFAGSTGKIIVNAGLSKAYSLPGLRLGWSVGSESYIQRAWSFHDFTFINVAFLSDWVASRILEHSRRMTILERTKKHLNYNLSMLLKWAKKFPELTFSRPDAVAITIAKLNLQIGCEEFIFNLRENYSVLLTAGKWHGLEGYIRIGYGITSEHIQKGLDRIGNYLEKFST